MKDYLKDIYVHFRPLLEELSKANLDYSKEPDKIELEIIQNWMKKNVGKKLLERDTLKRFFYTIEESLFVEEYSENNSEEDFYAKDIGEVLERFKAREQRIHVTWVLEVSDAKLEGFAIEEPRKLNRHSKDCFVKLLDVLQFPEEVKSIFGDKGKKRFNAVKNPIEFLEEMSGPMLGWPNTEENIIRRFCPEDSWEKRCMDLKKLLKLWIKNYENKTVSKKLDFIKFHQTTVLLLNLIPVASDDNILKTMAQYKRERDMVERALYDYYKKESLDNKNAYLQEMDEIKDFIGKFKEIMDVIYCEDSNKVKQDFLMSKFSNFIADCRSECDWILDDIQSVSKKCINNSICDYEYFQYLWECLGR